MAAASAPAPAVPHIAIFPFMAKGHTMPLTHLAHLLHRSRLAAVTFFTTPGNAAFVRAALTSTDAAVVELPFPQHVPGLPPGVESLEGLTCMSFTAKFVEAVALLQPQFEESLACVQPPVSLLIADAFLYWTNSAAARLGIPKVSFFATSVFAHVMREVIVRDNPCAALQGTGDTTCAAFVVPEFLHVQLTLSDLTAPFDDPDPTGPMRNMDGRMAKSIAESHGFIINSFYELESRYFDYWNRHVGPKAWPVGPFCLSRPNPEPGRTKPSWMEWLDDKSAAGRAVLYVALGTMVAVPGAQMKEIADGLDRAGVDFLWAVRPKDIDLGHEFEEQIKGRGKVVREWVDQWEILRHKCVRGFMSHCGWNSVLESISAGVPLLAWPMNAEQPMNAKLAVDELKIGVRVWTSDGSLQGFVGSAEVERMVRELMFGEKGKEAARNVSVLAARAQTAVSEGGSSWNALERMISELCMPTGNRNIVSK